MTRKTLPALAAGLILLAGCGSSAPPAQQVPAVGNGISTFDYTVHGRVITCIVAGAYQAISCDWSAK